MNKVELVAAVAEKTGLSKKDSEKAVAAFAETVIEALKGGDKVQLIGFGTFEIKERAGYTGHDPRTMEPVEIAASKLPTFKAGKAFKEAVK